MLELVQTKKWEGVLGSHGVGKCKANGEVLLSLCSEYNLVVTNALFKHTHTQKTSTKKEKKQKLNNKEEKTENESVVIFLSKILGKFLVFGAI